MMKVNSIALLVLGMACSAFAYAHTLKQQSGREKIAFLFERKGLSDEEATTITKKFSEVLQASEKFDVMAQEEMMKLFAEAKFSNLETCTYSYCLADAGKILGVARVMHGSIARRGKLFTLQLRMVDVRDATIVYDRRTEYSGEFDKLLSDVVPKEGRAASEYSLESNTEWNIISAAIVVTVGAIYSIYRALNKSGSSEGSGSGPPSTTQ